MGTLKTLVYILIFCNLETFARRKTDSRGHLLDLMENLFEDKVINDVREIQNEKHDLKDVTNVDLHAANSHAGSDARNTAESDKEERELENAEDKLLLTEIEAFLNAHRKKQKKWLTGDVVARGTSVKTSTVVTPPPPTTIPKKTRMCSWWFWTFPCR